MDPGAGNEAERRRVVAWVAAQVLPHESAVRAWLRRAGIGVADIDDAIQEAYARISACRSIDHVTDGRAYFFRTVRNLLLEQVRRSQIVRIDSVAEIDALDIVDGEPSPERVTSGRRELARVQRLIEELPARCRRVFELRKIEALPQREVARLLGVSENTVEKQAAKGLQLILASLAGDETSFQSQAQARDELKRRRRQRPSRR